MSQIGTTRYAPGWHEGRPMPEYLDDPAVSASTLWKLHDLTPAHLREDLGRENGRRESTAAQDLGTLVHSLTFEPDTFDATYVVLGRCEATKGDGARCGNQGSVFRDGQSFCGVRGHDPEKGAPMPEGLFTISRELHEQAKGMHAALMADPDAGDLLKAPGRREVVGVWQDEETGLFCRIRPDLIVEDDPTAPGAPEWARWSVTNLKTTTKLAKLEPYRRDFQRLGHEFKAAFYRMGVRALWGFEPQHFYYPVVEASRPYAVVLYRLNEDWLDMVEDDVRLALRRLAECVALDSWPGYGAGVCDLNAPEWQRNKLRRLDGVEFEEVVA